MNAFQKRCRDEIEALLARHDLRIGFAAQKPDDPAPDGAATFLRGDVVHGGRHYKLFVYADGAGANVARNWYVLESQDYASPEALIGTFCGFLERCFAGEHPVAALDAARK